MKNTQQTNQNVYRKDYNDNDSGKIFLIALIAPFVLALFFALIASSIADSKEVKTEVITSSLGYTIPYSICSFLLLVGIFFFYTKTNKIEYSAIRPKFRMKWQTYLIIVAIGIVSLFGVQYFIGSVNELLKVIGYPLEEGLTVINPTNVGYYFLSILLLAIMPALSEELLFRGVILHGLRSRFNDVCSVLLSGAMFALFHGNLQQLIYPFILGCIMGWIVLRTGSIISSILVHFINNFLVVTFAFIQNMTGFSISLGNAWWAHLIGVVLLVITALICYLIDRFYFKHKSEEKINQTSVKTSKFVYISLAVSAFIFLFMTVSAFVA